MSLNFIFMILIFYFRDILNPPRKLLIEAGIKSNMNILDYGCGPGGFSIAAAKLVIPGGLVTAVDKIKFALWYTNLKAFIFCLDNIKTIESKKTRNLSNCSIDMIILNDVYHEIQNKNELKNELHRILKKDGILYFSDHHMSENNIRKSLECDNLFSINKFGRNYYLYKKI